MTSPTTTDLQARDKQAVESEGTRPGLIFRPDVDIVERGEEFVVTADLPGVDDQQVKIHLEDGVLSIDANLAVEPDRTWNERRVEYRVGGYHRQFRLSDTIDVKGIQAEMRNGVLQVRLPKTDRHKPRQISVKAV